MKRSARAQGFTFVEVLAALVFLGILMPVIISALMLSNRAGLVAERSAIALQLGENRLNEMLLGGSSTLNATWGDFGAGWSGYHWELERRAWRDSSSMTELTMRVVFSVQGRDQEIALTTLESETQP